MTARVSKEAWRWRSREAPKSPTMPTMTNAKMPMATTLSMRVKAEAAMRP
jgi:hypothetical protein